MKKNRLSFIALALMVLFLVSSCYRIELYQNLGEEDANEMLVLLAENNIKAVKKKDILQNEVTYSIVVPEDEMVKARALLVRHNLPRKRELGLTGVYKEKGLIPTPDEQKARFLLALKGEIINSLHRIPQVVDADVVLNVPTKGEFADAETRHRQRPTASVVVKAKPLEGGESALSEAKIQQFVSNAVEEMNPRDVTVIITYITDDGRATKSGDVKSLGVPPVAPSSMGLDRQAQARPVVHSDELVGLKMDAESKEKLKVYILIFFVLLILLSSALIVVIIQGSRMRRIIGQLKSHVGDHPAIEGHIMDEGPKGLPHGQ